MVDIKRRAAAAASGVALAVLSSAAGAQTVPLPHAIFAHVNGASIPVGGDVDATGVVSLMFSQGPAAGLTTVCVSVVVMNFGTNTSSMPRVYLGPPGSSGALKIQFNLNGGTLTDGSRILSSCETITTTLATQIQRQPHKYYVEASGDDGSARGQLF